MLTISLIVFTDKFQGHVHTFYSKFISLHLNYKIIKWAITTTTTTINTTTRIKTA